MRLFYRFFFFIEKIGNLKKLKRDIKSFKAGVGMYEEYLQLNMNIELQENNSVLINLALKKYNVVLEENDNDFNCKYILVLFSLFCE